MKDIIFFRGRVPPSIYTKKVILIFIMENDPVDNSDRIQKTCYFFNWESTLINKYNDKNFNEGIHSALKDLVSIKHKEQRMNNIQLITIGVLILVIATMLPPLSPQGMGVTSLGMCFLGVILFNIISTRRNKS